MKFSFVREAHLNSIAWKNVTRHAHTTTQCVIAITISLIIMSLLFGLIGGMETDIKYNITHFLSGDVLIQNKEYKDNEAFNPSYYVMPNTSAIVDVLSSMPEVETISTKLHVPVTLVQEENFEVLTMTGVVFEEEHAYNNMYDYMVEGNVPQPQEKAAVIGAHTAETFGLSVGDTITLMGSTVLRGTNGMSVTISGIIKYKQQSLNERKMYVPLSVVQQFFHSPDASTEITLLQDRDANLSDNEFLQLITRTLREHDLHNTLYIAMWRDTNVFAKLFIIYRVIYLMIGAIFCLLGSLVVYNTIFMALIQRKYEMGVMGAMGFTLKELQRIFHYEVLYMVSLGSLIGLLVGNTIVFIMGSVGIRYKSLDLVEFFSDVQHPSLTLFWSTILFIYGTLVCYSIGSLPILRMKKYSVLDMLKD